MCIRDRYSTVKPHLERLQLYCISESKLFVTFTTAGVSIVPVSYTHLDVYKRQEWKAYVCKTLIYDKRQLTSDNVSEASPRKNEK